MTYQLRYIVAVLFLAILTTATASAQVAMWVTATAESAVSEENAVQKALRQAVRETVGIVMASETRVADMGLIRAAIFSRAAGYVRQYNIEDKQRSLDETFVVTVRAEVAHGKIKDDYLAIRNLIEDEGRPEFVVTIEEKSGSEFGVATWVRGAFHEQLDATGMASLHAAAANESIERQAQRAEAAGDHARAAQLRLQMNAPYEVKLVAYGEKKTETLYDLKVDFATVQVPAPVNTWLLAVMRSASSVLPSLLRNSAPI